MHKNKMNRSNIFRVAFAQAILISFCCIPLECFAANGERSLKLHNVHTGERTEIVFKRNGTYSEDGLNRLNRFLRDWRRNEQIEMDPKLFDLLWEVYEESDSQKHIHVFSAYRTSATNEFLRINSRGVAKKSQHTKGKAIDFALPDVKLSKLQAIAMRKQAGGVGIYPSSNSPFAHLDTGNVRHWPRLTRKQLVRLFPDERTVHIPNDGIPLSGFKQAKLDVQESRDNPDSHYASNRQSQNSIAENLFNHFDDTPVPKSKPSTMHISSIEIASLHLHIPKSKPASELISNEIPDSVSNDSNDLQLAHLPTIKPNFANQSVIGILAANSPASQQNNRKDILLGYFPNEEQDASVQDLDLVFAGPNQKRESVNPSLVMPSNQSDLTSVLPKPLIRETESEKTVDQPGFELVPTDFKVMTGLNYRENKEAESSNSQIAKTVEQSEFEIFPTVFKIMTGFSYGENKEGVSSNSQLAKAVEQSEFEIFPTVFKIMTGFSYWENKENESSNS